MPHINYVEFHVPDSKEASEFFKKAFGWDAQSWDDSGYMVVSHGEGPGIDAGIDNLKEGEKPHSVAVVTVDSVDEAAKAVEAAGGKMVVAKFAVPGAGYAAYFNTPGGLMMSIYEEDESAA